MIKRSKKETVIHLGNGTIIMGRCKTTIDSKEDQYYFVENKEGSPVGEPNDKYTGLTTDELPNPIRLVFDGDKPLVSIDMLIRDLKVIRDNLESYTTS